MSETASAAPAKQLVRNVDLALVNLTTLNAALKLCGLKVTARTKVEDRVVLLADHELELCKGDDKLEDADKLGGACSFCGGVSRFKDYAACPFCGTGEDQPVADSPAAAPAPKSAKAAKAGNLGKAAKAGKSKKEPKPSPAERRALATVETGKVALANTKLLEQAERRITGLLGDAMASQWKLGFEINKVYTAGLFKYRVVNGKPVHTFSGWCDSLGISPQYSRSLMHVAANFTEKQVRDIGVSKLSIVLRLPHDAREQALANAAGGATRSELEAEVRSIAPGASREHIASGDTTHARPGLAASNAEDGAQTARGEKRRQRAGRAVAANELTAIIMQKLYDIPLFARAKSAETSEPLRATNLASDPHAVLQLENSVALHFRIIEDDDGLRLTMNVQRADDSTAAE